MKSRSLWFGQARQIELREEELGSPGDHDILVAALYSGISHGTEMLVYRGEAPRYLTVDPSVDTMEGSFGFPIKFGYSSVGQVAKRGPGVTGLRCGDTVFVHHPHQSHYVVPQQLAFKLPPNLSPVLGVFAANLETAVNCLHDADIKLGDVVAIYGQGVVGLLVTQLAKRFGARKVFTVDRIQRRRTLSHSVGADVTFDPERDHVVDGIRENSDGLGADVVIEVSGAPDALDTAIKSAAFEGQVVVVSWYGMKPVTLHLGEEFHRSRLHLRSSQVSYLNPSLVPRWSKKRRMETVLWLLPQLRLAELISHTFGFEEAAMAYERIDHAPEEVLQVVLSYV